MQGFQFLCNASSCVEAEILPNVTSNTNRASISLTSENINPGKFTSESATVWSTFDSAIPIIAALALLGMNIILSLFESQLLMFICRKCKPCLLSGSHIIMFISEDL